MHPRRHRIGVVGLGYVGLCTAVTFASRGFKTVGIDVERQKVASIKAGNVPIHEPKMDQLLRRGLHSGSLEVTDEFSQLSKADTVYITVGTPSKSDGSIDLTYVENAAGQIGENLRTRRGYCVIVVKSTVIPGTTSSRVKPLIEQASGRKVGRELGLCANPEFLREGTAIYDSFHPDKLVIGADDKNALKWMTHFYKRFYGSRTPPIIATTPETAEMIKYASNGFLATKISFINTVANIAQNIPGVDVEVIAQAIGLDRRIGPLFLKAGPGYGGSCFHKDLQGLIEFSRRLGYDPILIRTTEEVNEHQAEEVLKLVQILLGSLEAKRITLLGLSFKKDTDDVREAVSIRVAKHLRKRGARVVAYDPIAMPNARKALDDTVEFASDPRTALKGSDCCVVLTEWDEFRRLTARDYSRLMRVPNLVDARRLYRPADFRAIRFLAIGLGSNNGLLRTTQNFSS